MVAYLLSPNRCNLLIAKVKNYNLNVTEVLDSTLKNVFSEFSISPSGSYQHLKKSHHQNDFADKILKLSLKKVTNITVAFVSKDNLNSNKFFNWCANKYEMDG